MREIRNFLQDLSQETGISFSIINEDRVAVFTSKSFEENSNVMYVSLNLGREKVKMYLNKQFKECIPLLKYTIEDKYSEIYSENERILRDILDGKDVSDEKVNKCIPFLKEGCILLLVKTEGNIHEAIDIINQIYKNNELITIICDDYIIVMVDFNEIGEHAKAIKEAINSNLYCKCVVSFSDEAHDKYGIKKAFDESKESMMLSERFSLREDILNYKKLLFEKIVYSLEPKFKNQFLETVNSNFNTFDAEIILTIDEFVNSGLNISEAAKKLYIHRNTLIYRLDKIKKETGFDIRNFKEATVFIIGFLIWRESK
jgi:hypothetical protein